MLITPHDSANIDYRGHLPATVSVHSSKKQYLAYGIPPGKFITGLTNRQLLSENLLTQRDGLDEILDGKKVTMIKFVL